MFERGAPDLKCGSEESVVRCPWLLADNHEAQLFVLIELAVDAVEFVSKSYLERLALRGRVGELSKFGS